MGRTETIGASPSGKAADFGSATRRFESYRPSHRLQPGVMSARRHSVLEPRVRCANMRLREEVEQLKRLGPMPADESDEATQERIDDYNHLVESVPKPVSDDEARVLVKLFPHGRGTFFGIAWGLLHLVESAPGWPLADALTDLDNWWIRYLRDRSVRGGRLPAPDLGATGEIENLGHVSTEGGPVLLIDRAGVGEWSGIEGDDYMRACALLDEQGHASAIAVGRHRGLLWDMPTGTADVWRMASDRLVLSRPWLNPDDENTLEVQARSLAELSGSDSLLLGRLQISSGWLAILWAPESGLQILQVPPTDGLALDLSVGHAAAVVGLTPGAYLCFQDEVRTETTSSVRCWIAPEVAREP